MLRELLQVLVIILSALAFLTATLYIISIRFVFVNLKHKARKKDLIISTSFYFGILFFALGEMASSVQFNQISLGLLLKLIALIIFLLAFFFRFKTNLERFKIYLQK